MLKRKDYEQETTRKSRKGTKKKDDDHVNTLVREANIECESVISGLREETTVWTREKIE